MKTPISVISQTHNALYIKREDLLPISFGGNKARKAEYFFKEIDSGDCDCIVTYGTSSSNHCRVVSNMAAIRGLACHIVSPEENAKQTFNSRMMSLFGAHFTIVPINSVHDTIEKVLDELRQQGKHPYFIAGGGHGTLGTQAYVDCYREIREFEEENGLHFDYIFLPSGTGTTQAGLVCGQLMENDNRVIVGISIARKNPRGRQIVLDSIRDYLKEQEIAVSNDRIEKATVFDDSYTADGYGQADEKVLRTIKSVMTEQGIPLDSTYTGKAYTGMMDYLEREHITGKNILFIHTGGTPLFFDDLKEISNHEYSDFKLRYKK